MFADVKRGNTFKESNMSHHLEVRYQCNGCNGSEYVPIVTNTERTPAPKGFVTIWLNDVTVAPLHYCYACAQKFPPFIKELF